MKLCKAIIAGSILVAVHCSCETDDISCERRSENQATRNEALPPFHAIVCTVDADLYIHQGQGHTVQAEGPENVVNALEFNVEDGKVLISSTECFTAYALNVLVYMPEISSVQLSSQGSIQSGTALRMENLHISLSGGGDMVLEVEADSMYTELVGSGTAKLAGNTPIHYIVSTGDAELQAYGLETEKTNILSDTPKNSYLSVNSELVCILRGSGSVFYRGTPTIDLEVTGAGQLVEDN